MYGPTTDVDPGQPPHSPPALICYFNPEAHCILLVIHHQLRVIKKTAPHLEHNPATQLITFRSH